MGMNREQKYAKMELRGSQYNRNWKSDLSSATCNDPGCEWGGAGALAAAVCTWLWMSSLVFGARDGPCPAPAAAHPRPLPPPPPPPPPPSPRLPAPVCCLSIFCGQCVSFHLRKRVLRGDMTRYIW